MLHPSIMLMRLEVMDSQELMSKTSKSNGQENQANANPIDGWKKEHVMIPWQVYPFAWNFMFKNFQVHDIHAATCIRAHIKVIDIGAKCQQLALLKWWFPEPVLELVGVPGDSGGTSVVVGVWIDSTATSVVVGVWIDSTVMAIACPPSDSIRALIVEVIRVLIVVVSLSAKVVDTSSAEIDDRAEGGIVIV